MLNYSRQDVRSVQGNRVLTKEAIVPALADPDVIGVNNKEKRPACSPSSFRRRPESRPAFRHMGDRRRKPVLLDSGFRRNDAGDVIFVAFLVPKIRN